MIEIEESKNVELLVVMRCGEEQQEWGHVLRPRHIAQPLKNLAEIRPQKTVHTSLCLCPT